MRKTVSLVLLLVLTGLLVAACGGGGGGEAAPAQPAASIPAGNATAGRDLYAISCSACHGPNGEGVQGLGKPFPESGFVKSLTDAELLDFIKKGRPVSDPANTTGVDMPPKGGNPALTDAQLADIIAYIRTLNH